MKSNSPSNGVEDRPNSTLVGLVLSRLLGSLLFVPLWAGMNFAFGSALDGPIAAVIMETPCQRLAGTTEPLRRYTLGQGKVILGHMAVPLPHGFAIQDPDTGRSFQGSLRDEPIFTAVHALARAMLSAGPKNQSTARESHLAAPSGTSLHS